MALYPPQTTPPAAPPPVAAARTAQERPDRAGSRASRTGVWIAIGAISMSFAALTSAMVVRQGAAPDWRHFHLPQILLVNTLVLLASSGTLEWSGRQRDLRGLYVTLSLGLLFVVGQVVAWRQLAAQGLFLRTAPSSAFFYVLTVLHALHVIGGLGGLAYVLQRLRRRIDERSRGALGAATLYWHFMDGLWLYLFVLLVTRV